MSVKKGNNEEKKGLWIIRYSDNSMRAHYGTLKTAAAVAREDTKKNHLSYVIS